jgi:predicted transcriptional regulator
MRKQEMKLAEIQRILEAQVLLGHHKLDTELSGGAASDLMSDLLRNPRENALLLTGLTSIQVIRTAIIASLGAVVFVRGKEPGAEMISMAQKHELPLLTTSLNMYSSCGRLYGNGLNSIR